MRVPEKCCGDCGSCKLLLDGKVDMVPCALDQIFQRIQRLEMKIDAFKELNIAEAPEI